MCRSPLAAHLLPLPPLLPDIRTTSRITRWSKTMWKVFLTGATGFLGGELAVALSKTDRAEKIACLVRAECDAEARERLEGVFLLHGDAYDPDRIVAVAGDLSDDQLETRLAGHPALKDINLVIHAGANTSFLKQKYPVLVETNVRGTHRVASWASQL